tara:strand:- start:824 stop:1660 length:837 start_codon:yes stop_codon:yes gene_type:complete
MFWTIVFAIIAAVIIIPLLPTIFALGLGLIFLLIVGAIIIGGISIFMNYTVEVTTFAIIAGVIIGVIALIQFLWNKSKRIKEKIISTDDSRNIWNNESSNLGLQDTLQKSFNKSKNETAELLDKEEEKEALELQLKKIEKLNFEDATDHIKKIQNEIEIKESTHTINGDITKAGASIYIDPSKLDSVKINFNFNFDSIFPAKIHILFCKITTVLKVSFVDKLIILETDYYRDEQLQNLDYTDDSQNYDNINDFNKDITELIGKLWGKQKEYIDREKKY